MMKKLFKPAIAFVAAVSCAVGAMAGDPYKVRVEFTEDEEGAMIYMINF